MNEKLQVSPSPHLKGKVKTKHLMRDVVIALVPAMVASVWLFGWAAVKLLAVTAAAAVAFEYGYQKLLKRPSTVADWSAVVTGVLLALNLPPGLPLWMAVLGAAIAIVLVKQLFGGIGFNLVNPALAARAILLISFPVALTTWVAPQLGVDAVSGATPLRLLAMGTTEGIPSLRDLFLGIHAGSLGETSVLALLIGGLYLVFRKVISPLIPVLFIGSVFVFAWAFGQDPFIHLLSGGLFLGAIFMATDYTTSPVTTAGKVLYALGCGFVTVVIRVFANMPEGVSFAILAMNLLVPLLERYTRPRILGCEKGATK